MAPSVPSEIPDTEFAALCGACLQTWLFKLKEKMLYTVAAVLIILWLFGFVTSYTVGGLIHVLLVVAIVVVLIRVISGRRPF